MLKLRNSFSDTYRASRSESQGSDRLGAATLCHKDTPGVIDSRGEEVTRTRHRECKQLSFAPHHCCRQDVSIPLQHKLLYRHILGCYSSLLMVMNSKNLDNWL